jgi:hypothetical protein
MTDVNKKRGRKPKGGKLVSRKPDEENEPLPLENVILHLKCSLSDLVETNSSNPIGNNMIYNPEIPPEIQTYNVIDNKVSFSKYEDTQTISTNDLAYSKCHNCQCNTQTISTDDDNSIRMKDINMKLKQLKINLYKNINQDKKSACFWCTYEYDNPSCYVPKYETDRQIFGYGSFCRPECAVAYLMNENIDDSTKFERYHLLNRIYGRIYDFKTSIKPAPDPHYLLEKFFGNLTIQEYRKLLKTAHVMSVIDKPMTRVLPELHDDNDNFVVGVYGEAQTISTNTIYKVARQSDKPVISNKRGLLRDKFGVS